MHGKFVFQLQKYQIHQQETNYFELTKQLQEGYISPGLQELCGYYSNRLSYEEVARLVERIAGERLLSDQKSGQIVSDKALKISQEIYKNMEVTLVENNHDTIEVNPQVDIYNPESKETLLFDDGIQVKGQKAQRHPSTALEGGIEEAASLKSTTSAITCELVILQKASGKFEYITTPIKASGENLLNLASVVKAKILQEYGSETTLLNLVAITDGAKAIRQRLLTIFGVAVTVILDWYHLCKKVRKLMSMIAANKLEKARHLKFLLSHLWQGNTVIALEYLRQQVQARNLDKWQELIGYARKTSTRNYRL